MPWVDQFVEMLFPLDSRQINIEGAFLLKQTNLPASIFKYRNITESSLKNLQEGTVWLADPRSLNDPYDCAHSTNMDRMSRDLWRNMPSFLADKLPSDKFTPDVISQLSNSDDPDGFLVDTLLSDRPAEHREQIKEAIREVLHALHEDMAREYSENLKGAFKLCSFSERLDSTVMWAHYANYHKGFCIEYDVRAFPPSDYRVRFLYPVIYTDSVYDATPYFMRGVDHDGFNNLHLNLAGLFKAIDWSYEREWRLLFANGMINEPQAYPMGKPKAVYLGSRILSGDQSRILSICSKLEIDVRKMRHSTTKFLMEPCSVEDADRRIFRAERNQEDT